jgi:hypothetical protein
MLNLHKVEYDNAIAKEAAAMRTHQAYGGKNIATICLTNDVKVTEASIPPGAPGVTPKHSEVVAWESLEASGNLAGKIRIKWIYTERYPCGHNAGMRDCYSLLESIMKDHGETGLDTPVYFTYEYPDDSYMFHTLMLCQIGYEVYLDKSEADQREIEKHAPKLIEIGKYILEEKLDFRVKTKEITTIARELYAAYRDEATAQLRQNDL